MKAFILGVLFIPSAFAANYKLQNEYLKCIEFDKKISKDLAGGFAKIVESLPPQAKTKPENMKKFETIYNKHLNAKTFTPYFLESLSKNVPAMKLKEELDKCNEGVKSDVTYENTMKDVTAKMKTESGSDKPNPYMNMFKELFAQAQMK